MTKKVLPVKVDSETFRHYDVLRRGSFFHPRFGKTEIEGSYENGLIKLTQSERKKVPSSGRWVNKSIQGVPLRWREPSPYLYELIKVQDGPGSPSFYTIDYRGPWKLYDYFGSGVCWSNPERQYFKSLVESTPIQGGLKHSFVKREIFRQWSNNILVFYGEVTANERNAFNVALLNKIGDRKGSFGIAAAEFMKSVDTVASALTSIVRGAAAAKRGDLRGMSKAFNTFKGSKPKSAKNREWHANITKSHVGTTNVANRWLEAKYAWTPIVMDANAALALIAKGLDVVLTGHTRLGRVWDDSGTRTLSSGRETLEVEGQYGLSSSIYWGVHSHSLRQLARLGLSDVLGIVWDLTPYSFIADWVVPMAKVISALDATVGLEFISGTETEFREFRCTRTVEQVRQEGFCSTPGLSTVYIDKVIRSKVEGSRVSAYKYINRRVLRGFPKALPYITNPLSSHHTMTALSLIKSSDFERNYVRKGIRQR